MSKSDFDKFIEEVILASTRHSLNIDEATLMGEVFELRRRNDLIEGLIEELHSANTSLSKIAEKGLRVTGRVA